MENRNINKVGVFVCYLFSFSSLLIPTILPIKLLLLLFMCSLSLIIVVQEKRIGFESDVVVLIISLYSPLLSMCIYGYQYGQSVSSILSPVIYILTSSFGIYYYFKKIIVRQEQIYSFFKVYSIFSIVLAVILLFEAFGHAFYKDVVGVVSINKDAINNAYDFSNKLNATTILDLYVKRPYGPFRYQLIAGYVLMPSYFFILYYLNQDISIIKVCSLVLLIIAMFLTSKGVLIASLVVSYFTFNNNNLNVVLRNVIKLLLVAISVLIVVVLIVLPIFYDIQFGSVVERLNRVSLAISIFLSNDITKVLIGEGLGYTWYGNEYFELKYENAVADIGFYINYLIQGGLLFLCLMLLYIFIVICSFFSLPKGSTKKLLYGILLVNIIVWLTISNFDLIYLIFMIHGLISALNKINFKVVALVNN
ncbi:hypothetical protein [Vibrio sp. B1FLJ16]|uniref:hypothetical protein n=1 Tax=Vibrio sp. B1FLJ16 TaxID=2751178 RepID=UPI0015F3EE56|nr:hypothetical protein [Vibrio sp. B1FLJ16]CAD7797624.1 hypothetical protein ACOMICROBIO_EPCKBFOG_00210 [Vibrio sp. B1FLJ16]CAE6881442.1 hypothetical protein ACOMICROBIO_EPCKBFOG_00210 [Vibrio sp. B1FLJ16]